MVAPRFYITDVFTTSKYGGNPLATFVDCETLSDEEMQRIAKEINFSETTFIMSRKPVDGAYVVRIFTPKSEVDFAGHPTLGTAHVIRHRLIVKPAREITLQLRGGRIPVTFAEGASDSPLLWMKQMAPKFGKSLEVNSLAEVLGLEPTAIDESLPIEEVSTGFPHIVVPLRNLSALKQVRVQKERYFSLVNDAWAKIILVFAREGYDVGQSVSVRVFGDYYGIPEDAATGSGNGCLAAYLLRHGVFGGAVDLLSGQGYEMGRPSTLALRANATPDGIEVFVGGSVVDVAEGVWQT